MNFILSISFFIIVLVVSVAILITYAVKHFYFDAKKFNHAFQTTGLIIFKIDEKRQTIARVSDNTLSKFSPFDYGSKLLFKQYSYKDFNEFLEAFEYETANKIRTYLRTKDKHNETLTIEAKFKPEFSFSNLRQKDLKLLNIKQITGTYKINLASIAQDNGYFYCSFSWKINFPLNQKIKLYKLSNIENNIDLIDKKFYFIGAFAVKNRFNFGEDIEQILQNIVKILGLSRQLGFFWFKNGVLYFLVLKNTAFGVNLLTKKVKKNLDNLVLENNLYSYWNNFGFFAINGKKDINPKEIMTKANFLLFDQTNKNKVWLLEQQSTQFENFKSTLSDYEQKNEYENFQKETIDVIDITQNNQKIYELAQIRVPGFEKKQSDFLNAWTINNVRYGLKQNRFLIENHTNNFHQLVLLSEYDFCQNYNNYYKNRNLTLILKQLNTTFNAHLILNELEQTKNTTKVGIYIDHFSDETMRLINSNKIQTLIICKDFLNKLSSDSKLNLCLMNLVEAAKNNQIEIIYENPPQNLSKTIVQKLEIAYVYQT
ncbi:MHO_4530 family protein [Mycoplasmopsis columbinasalis]|uniref:Uncharacterized protein n=1 Tax=Mycoplasmopsis columbinasalis TaxID=114880 RepID=A0A449B9J1_9BACT|nr:hypothetical protein [Mycoplasmopsis columbinasalis]VEU77850.1 Uncharacterised protein [Mycoplasmopsis columbinasalis]